MAMRTCTARYISRRLLNSARDNISIKNENTAGFSKLHEEYASLLKERIKVTEEYERAMTSSSVGSKASGSDLPVYTINRYLICSSIGVFVSSGIVYFCNRRLLV